MRGALTMISWIDSDAPVFFDTDCLGCFLWTSNLLVLRRLLAGRIRIPEEVAFEIMRRRAGASRGLRVRMAQSDLGQFISTGTAVIVCIEPESKQHDEFDRLVSGGFQGKRLGRGESAALVHARFAPGIVASNNRGDIVPYCQSYGLRWMTTTRMIVDAVSSNKLAFEEAKHMWERMVEEERRMPYPDFQGAWDNEARCEAETAATLDHPRSEE